MIRKKIQCDRTQLNVVDALRHWLSRIVVLQPPIQLLQALLDSVGWCNILCVHSCAHDLPANGLIYSSSSQMPPPPWCLRCRHRRHTVIFVVCVYSEHEFVHFMNASPLLLQSCSLSLATRISWRRPEKQHQ